MGIALTARIEQRIDRHGHHWCWTGPVSTSGTPEIWQGRTVLSVRRWCWERAHGQLEPGQVVLRSCRERTYVAPDHARLLDRTKPLLAAALRQRCGLTHRHIGQLLDVNVSVVHRWGVGAAGNEYVATDQLARRRAVPGAPGGGVVRPAARARRPGPLRALPGR